ncbi:HlyD family secretion protein [Sphingomonas sp. BN140010]|uniref:HlyD family secretion protein n=1 Tax=Sphingomonas arvum TaxID=2992113 RepID=A0ABT3JBQ5_9SPHN|nr:HlyD family secretion protein [Sphingomonas sp. BN140010]MCW3796494.1 HlyD family secretion protein [Sphingomonas sp. BN140010]
MLETKIEGGEEVRSSRKWVKPAVLGGALLIIAGGGYGYSDYRANGQFIQSTNDAFVQADQTVVAAKLGGYVKAVPVRENQQLAAGTLLIEIDPTDYQTRISQAEAQIETALASSRTTRASLAEARAGVDQAAAALRTAEADLAFANREVARYRPLVASGAEPASALSNLIAQRDKASGQVGGSRASLVAARRKLVTIGAQGGQSEAEAGVARTQRAAALNDLANTRLRAPLAGRVANVSARPGQLVQPGQRLMTIVPSDDIYIQANFKETQIGLMRPGQPVTIKVDALSGIELKGDVESITPGTGANFSVIPPQNATGNFTKIVQRVPVRIRVHMGPAIRRLLVPGLSAEVEVDTRGAKGELKRIRAEARR